MKNDFCIRCGRKLSADEIGLHKKLFNRAAAEFMCIECCAAHFDVSVKLLENKIEEFKKMGCTLFENKG